MNGERTLRQIRKSEKVALIEDLIGGIFLLGLAMVPLIEVVIRRINGSGFLWSQRFLQHIVIWIAWVGGIVASREGVHLSMSSGQTTNRNPFQRVFDRSRDLSVASVNMAMAVASVSFLIVGFSPEERIGFIPIRLALVILPIGHLFMFLRALWRPGQRPSFLLVPGVVLGLFFSWPSVVRILGSFWGNMPPEFFDSVDSWYAVFRWLRWPLIFMLLTFVARGLPIYLMLGGTALFLFSGNWGALESIPNEAYNLLIGNIIPAIPLFTIAGFLLSASSAGEQLIRFFRAALGWLPGGLATVTVVACAYFTTFTGASGVTILALGGLLAKVLVESGHYGRSFSRGLITSSGSIGLLFPPALPIIMFGVAAQVSIRDMFFGGFIPGVLLVLALSVMGVSRALRNKSERTPFVFRDFLSAGRHALGYLILPIIILVVYFGGLANLAETAALTVLYVLCMTLVNGELKKDLILQVLRRGVPVIGGVLIILAMAKGLSYFIVDANVPTILTAFFRDTVSSRFVFLILLNLILLVTGTLMDIYSAILVVAPLIIPLGELYGVHPVQLGIIFLANLQLGYLTPPVGMNLFLASYTFNEPVTKVYKQVIPFFLILFVVVLLITYVPWFSLALIG